MAAAVMCPNCQRVAPEGSESCPVCGESLLPNVEPTKISVLTDSLRGTKLGEYRIEERIGIGGMGIVYRAVHPLIGNEVAIKVLRPDVIESEADLQKFLGEAQAINKVRHRGVVSIFGAGDTPDGRKYLVMELLTGESLEARRAREGKLPTSEVATIMEEVLAALQAVHATGVVHRDLKPANVFLARESDGRPYVKLLDFGLARRSNKEDVSKIAGTPDYISPEHSRGKPPGPPADLYSLGVMAFQLLTGRLPFIGANPMEVMAQHVHKPPPDPGVLDGSIPPAMCELVLELLAKKPEDRPTAAQVRARLGSVATQLRTAATQDAVPAVSAERPTAPELGRLVAGPESRDTDPHLGAQGPIPVLEGQTPLSTPQLVQAPTSTEVPAMRDTASELPRRRRLFVLTAVVAAVGLVLGLSVKAIHVVRQAGNQPLKARKTSPELPPLEPEVIADWREVLKERTERAQLLAREQRSPAEADAKKLIGRLEDAQPEQQEALEAEVAELENRVASQNGPR